MNIPEKIREDLDNAFKKVIVDPLCPTFARIGHNTSTIQVKPEYNNLDITSKEMLILNLLYIKANDGMPYTERYLESDNNTIEAMHLLYPNETISNFTFIFKELLANSLASINNPELTKSRIINIAKYAR